MEQSNESKAIFGVELKLKFSSDRYFDLRSLFVFIQSSRRSLSRLRVLSGCCSVTQKAKWVVFIIIAVPDEISARWLFLWKCNFHSRLSSHLILDQWEGHRWGTLTSLLNQLYMIAPDSNRAQKEREVTLKLWNSRHTDEIQWNEEKQSIDYVWNVFIQFFSSPLYLSFQFDYCLPRAVRCSLASQNCKII